MFIIIDDYNKFFINYKYNNYIIKQKIWTQSHSCSWQDNKEHLSSRTPTPWHISQWDVQEAMAMMITTTSIITIRAGKLTLNSRFPLRKNSNTNYPKKASSTRRSISGLLEDGPLIAMIFLITISQTSMPHTSGSKIIQFFRTSSS